MKSTLKLILLVFTCTCIISCSTSPINHRHQELKKVNSEEYVVLIHGIRGNDWFMSGMSKYLNSLGYKTVNIDYPSTKFSIDNLVDLIHDKMMKEINPNSKIHFVGHSMGGLIARGIISKYSVKNLGRVVQLGTPNHGSKLADNFETLKLFGLIFGPAGHQLTTQEDSRKGLFKPIDYELGSLAGSRNINPMGLMLDGPNDGTVAVESTKIQGMKDHHVINASHIFFPFYNEAQYQTAYFLQKGYFHKV